MTKAPAVPLKHIAGINERALSETTDPDLEFGYIDIGSVGQGELVASPALLRFMDAPSHARRLVQSGDTIVSTVRTYLRAVWPVPTDCDDLVVSTGFAVLTPRSINPRFFSWYVRSDVFIDEVVARSVGVSYPAINALDLGEISIRLPGLEEQRAIADYLDAETARIDALITKKRRMINLLEERELSLVDQVFGPTCRERLVRLGRSARIQTGVTVSASRRATDSDVTVPYLRVANVQHGSLDLDEVKTISLPLKAATDARIEPGDVLMTEGGDIDKLGRGTVWNGQIENCVHQNHVFAVRVDRDQLDPGYLAHMTRTSHARSYFESTGVQSTNLASTNSTKVADFKLSLPDVPEQQRRCRVFEKERSTIADMTAKLTRQIDLLAERRQALITAAVTGAIEIPGVAA